MDDLIAWLREQIDEDERIAGSLAADGYPKHDNRVLSVEGTMDVPWPDRWNPTQVLAECEAKRRIIASACSALTEAESMPYGGAAGLAEEMLKLLAEMYAALGRPGYQESWRPA